MLKKYVRLLSLIIALISIVTSFSGCKKKTEEDSEFSDYYVVVDSQTKETVKSKENDVSKNSDKSGNNSVSANSCAAFMKSMPEKLKGTTITYFYWWDPKTQMEKETIANFEKTTGIKVKTEVASYSEFTTQLAAKISAGNSPDIVRLLSNAMYQVNSLQPITNSGYDFSDDVWNKQLMKDYTYNGKIYATNLNQEHTAILDPWILYYNTKTIKSNDLEDPYTIWKKDPTSWTWEKLWSLCSQFLDNNGHKTDYAGLQCGNMYTRTFGARYYDYDSDAGKWVNLMGDSTLVSAYQDQINKFSTGLMSTEPGLTGLERGKLLFLGHGPFPARKRDENFATLKKNGTLGCVPVPTDSKYQVLYEYTAFGIPQGAKNIEAVPYYLRYVLDKANYNMDQVYENAQMKEVVEYAISSKKMFFGENEIYELKSKLMSGTAEQVKGTLDAYSGQVEDRVKQYNEQIKYLSK